MDRRQFFGQVGRLTALAYAFNVLPPSCTYSRIWRSIIRPEQPIRTNLIWHGDGPPDPNTGERHDFYVDDQTGEIYYKAGGWHQPETVTV